jgi:EmrB/QacA subfamily drug resistance transporter
MTMLIVFRGVQGLGAGALFPISLAVIGDLYTPAERGKYQGLFGAVFGLSSVIGPLLGGWLTESVSWHWIFLVNIPIGLIALFVIWRLLPTIKRADASRNLDFLGGGVFIVAVGSLLIGLTNKTGNDWATPQVGGLLLVAAISSAIFVWVESRAKEPIVPLDLWRGRTYASSITSTFLISFGFFGAAVFLPQWFQFVKGVSPTDSGLQSLALLAGLIFSSIAAGQIVARTGRYKAIVLGSMAIMAVGLGLMTQIRSDTDLPIRGIWMFITGLGIGPTLSVFTIIVQNAVPFQKLGVATSNLTFFRQFGGSIGLALLGTVFANRLTEEIPNQLVAAGLPPQAVDQFASSGGSGTNLVVVGEDLGQKILSQVPDAARAIVEPLIPAIVNGIHQAFSLAISEVFLIGAITTVAAAIVAIGMKEIPLRAHGGPEPAPSAASPTAAPSPHAHEPRAELPRVPRPATD